MKIPKKIHIAGQTITIEFSNELLKNEDCYGESLFEKNKIILEKNRVRNKIEQTYLHEMIHFILFHMDNELWKDELFVNSFATFLHQVLTSSEGDLK